MDIFIKTKSAKRYQLVFDSNVTRPPLNTQTLPPAQKLSAAQTEAILNGAKPETPKDWSALWNAIKPAGAKTLTAENDILIEIKALATKYRIHLEPVNEPLKQAVPVNKAGSAKAGSQVELGQARIDKSAHTESAESKAAPHSEKTATSSAAPAEAGDQAVANTECASDPVSLTSGEEMIEHHDFALPGPMRFVWKRTYRSAHIRDIGLGVGWSHSGSEYLEESDKGLHYIDDEGRRIPFNKPQVNQRSKYLPEGLDLDRISENAYLLKQEGQWDKVFVRSSSSVRRFRLSQLRHAGYTPASNVLGIRSAESGFCLTFHYSGEHKRLTSIKGSWGKSLRIARDSQGRVDQVYLVNDIANKEKHLAAYRYSDQGDLISHRNAKGVGENYQYQNHLIQKRTLRTGFQFHFEWDGTDHKARCTHVWGDRGIYEYWFDWDPSNRTSKTTDSRGFQATYRYNEYGQIVEHIDNEGGLHRTDYVNGRKDAYTDPLGHRTEYFYDDENHPVGLRDALGHSVTVGYFQGKPTSFIDKDKTHWRREYNRKGQLIALSDPYNQSTRYEYNTQGLVTSVTDPLGRRTRYQWSEHGDLLTVSDALGHQRKFTYDTWGRLASSEFLIGGKNSAGTVSFEYNATDFIEKITAANGDITSYDYNDNDQLSKHSDPQGRTTEFMYDGLSQVIERVDAEGNSLKYEYDTERNLTALINEKGERYQFFYDGCERLTKEIGFDGREQNYQYNKAGHLIKHMDAGVVLTEFERDALGQMLTKTSKAKKNGQLEEEKARYHYDPKGRLSETYNQHQYLAFEYTRFGTLSKEHHSDINERNNRVQSSMVDIGYSNIWPGIRSGIHLPDGQKIGYEFNAHNQFTHVSLNGNSIAAIERDQFGREIARSQGQLVTETQYDPMGRLQKQHSYHKHNKAAGPIQREYGYDKFGNLSQLTDGNDATRYVYDLINRLEKVEGRVPEKFTFDPASNLLGSDGEALGKSSGNRLLMQGDRKFTYDQRGNLIKENRGKEGKLETKFEYNLNNQLIKVDKDGQCTEYKYDPLGRRIEKKDAFGSTRYLWAGDQLAQEQRGQIKKTYLYEPESFKPVAMVQDGKIYHYHLDHLGTPKELSDEQGKVVWKVKYKTYGNVALKEVEEVENNLRFQGQYFDEETGLHYNRHRYYNPHVGQFITQDPIGLLGGVNGYQYAPNPVGWVDPFGLTCKENSWNKFQKDTKGHFPNSAAAATSYNRMQEVRAMDNAIRPDVTDYLPSSYIDAHEAKFAGGASYFAPKWALDEYGRDNVGRTDGQFVMTKAQMDDVLARSGGNMALIEAELGIPAGDWQKNEMVVIEIADPQKHNVRMSTGREEGANDLWLPGGKLPTGHDEAVTDAIPKGSYKEMSIAEATKNAKKKT